MTQDRIQADRLPLTQEFLAQMLGTRRASVTVAAGTLQKAGLIAYTRAALRFWIAKSWKRRPASVTRPCRSSARVGERDAIAFLPAHHLGARAYRHAGGSRFTVAL